MDEKKSPLILEEEKPEDKLVISKKFIPNDYIPIKLESQGLLSAPKVLHFKDFSMKDALDLNVLDEEDQAKALVAVLNNMLWEKDTFDCANLHINELMQILYSIQTTFFPSDIEKEYVIDDTLPDGEEEGQIHHPSNIDIVSIPLNKLRVHRLDLDSEGNKREERKQFKEPFTIKDTVTKNKIVARLNRIKDLIIAQDYCKEKYAEQFRTYAPLKKELLKIQKIKDAVERELALDTLLEEREEDYAKYQKFLIDYTMEHATIVECLVIQKFIYNDGEKEVIEEIDSIEKALAVNARIGLTIWEPYNEIIEEYKFGVVEEYSFFSEKAGKTITRPFRFEFTDFLPHSPGKNGKRYTINFGD